MGKPARQLTSGMPDLSFDSGLPCNIDAEKTILGAILLDNDAFFDDCCEDIREDDFSLDSHRRIYLRMSEIMYGLVEGAHNVDIVTLAAELERHKERDTIGGVAYLASLTEGLPRRPVIAEYVRIVKDKSKLRRIMLVCSAAIARAADQGETALKIQAALEEQLIEVSADQKMDAVKASAVVGTIEAAILAKRNQNLEKTALDMTWGIEDLDKKTKGIYGGELTILAADSGSGKTQAMMQMVLANALEGIPVGIFSCEMPKEKLLQRLYPLMSDILTADHMRDPRLMNIHTHVPELKRISAEIAKLPIWIDDTSPLSIQKLRARAKMMRRRHGVRIIAVDYLQLLENPGKVGPEETRGVVFGLRDLAKGEPNCAVIALSQFSKEQGFVKKRRRTKGDLYGGSAIHHAAQNIVIITMEDSEKRDPGDDLDVEIMVDKSREGTRGRVTCVYNRKKLKFENAIQKEMKYGNSGSSTNAESYKDRSAGRD
jgi:replicative DNA helicase